jgi:hypothetical protein
LPVAVSRFLDQDYGDATPLGMLGLLLLLRALPRPSVRDGVSVTKRADHDDEMAQFVRR